MRRVWGETVTVVDNQAGKMIDLRRTHKRVRANVKLAVEWEEDCKLQSIHTFTLDVSHSGCLAVLSADLVVRQKVRLINQQSGSVAEARLVWRNPTTSSAGFELLKPDENFWNR
jgi:hypothetical protein